MTSTPGTCGDDDARVPGTEYLINTDRRVGRCTARRQPAESTTKADGHRIVATQRPLAVHN